jgi:hypothetical protein
LESAIEKHGAPKHIISDQAKVFIGEVFAELLDSRNIKPRLGAIGRHGSISVTERVIKTLKYEWLKRTAIIKDFDHLTKLCDEFEDSHESKEGILCPNINGIRKIFPSIIGSDQYIYSSGIIVNTAEFSSFHHSSSRTGAHNSRELSYSTRR